MFTYIVCFLFFGAVSAVVSDYDHYGDHVVPRNVTPLCLSHTTHWMSQLRQGEPWALRMLDSWTKLPSGVLLGSSNHVGNFDQCIAVTVQDEEASFQGQFCRASIDLNIPGQYIDTPSMIYSFCLPSSCSSEEIPQLFQEIIAPELGIEVDITFVNPNDCYIKEEFRSLPIGSVIFIAVICILVAAVVLSAIAEWRLGEKTPALVRACSLTSTCRSLFNTRKHTADISCLHGLRVGSMLWIVLGHRYDQERWLPLSNPYYKEDYFYGLLKMTVVNAMPAVDTFFMLSGLLICISFLREVHRYSVFDVIKFYIYRYLRLIFPIIIVILLYITVMPLTGHGPLWNNYWPIESTSCKHNWWTNLVFVNNYINKEGTRTCLGQTWYTAVDMQLAWLSPLVLLPLYHSPRAGLQLITILILISCFIPFTVTYIYHFPPTNMMAQLDTNLEGVPPGNFSLQIYNATQCRATPYLCGILFGTYIFKNRTQKVILKKSLVYVGWILATGVALAVVYSLSVFYQKDYVYNLVGSSFYAGFHRLGWSVALIWIIFACMNGYGGLVDRILSWNLLLPLSRLTYCTFLLHMIPMVLDSATKRSLSHYSDFDAVHGYFGDISCVYFMAIALYVLVEGPILSLLKIAFSKGVPANNKTKETQQTEKN